MNNDEIMKFIKPNYSNKDLHDAYKRLMNVQFTDKETEDAFGCSSHDNLVSDNFFFKHRIMSHRKGKQNIFENVRKMGLEKWEQIVVSHNKTNSVKANDITKATPRDYYTAGTAGKAPCQFKPRVASIMAKIFNPKTVIDFSAGWGDRAIGFCAKGVNYIGVDSNINLKNAYEEMSAFYNIHPAMYFQKSETFDFSKHEYDMIFTSPPYFDTEIYEHMDQFDSYKNWSDTFLKPVVTNSWKHLSANGYMCLNIPENIYNDIKSWLGPATKFIKMYLNTYSKHEIIYCWHKTEKIEEKIEEKKEKETQMIIENFKSFEFKDGKLYIKF